VLRRRDPDPWAALETREPRDWSQLTATALWMVGIVAFGVATLGFLVATLGALLGLWTLPQWFVDTFAG
jgi:hypothetical protein